MLVFLTSMYQLEIKMMMIIIIIIIIAKLVFSCGKVGERLDHFVDIDSENAWLNTLATI